MLGISLRRTCFGDNLSHRCIGSTPLGGGIVFHRTWRFPSLKIRKMGNSPHFCPSSPAHHNRPSTKLVICRSGIPDAPSVPSRSGSRHRRTGTGVHAYRLGAAPRRSRDQTKPKAVCAASAIHYTKVSSWSCRSSGANCSCLPAIMLDSYSESPAQFMQQSPFGRKGL